MAAITTLGLTGPMQAYPGFLPKASSLIFTGTSIQATSFASAGMTANTFTSKDGIQVTNVESV